MKIEKEKFMKFLEVLVYNGCIDIEFSFDKNIVKVYGKKNAIYYFNEENNLINPQIFDIQQKINELEKEKNILKNKMQQEINVLERRKNNLKNKLKTIDKQLIDKMY